MRVRVVFRIGSSSSSSAAVFTSVFVPARAPWGPLLGSAAGHAVVLRCLPAVLGLLPGSNGLGLAGYQVEPLRLRVPEIIYYTSKTVDHKKKPRAAAPRRELPAAAAASSGSGATPAPPRRAFATPVRKGLELPQSHQTDSRMAAIVLQPDVQLAAPRIDNLPALAFWARQAPEPAKPAPKKFIVPGRRETDAAVSQLDAPPVLDVPNRQPRVADLNIDLAPPPQPHQPVLAVANSTTVPVREKSGQSQAGTLDRQEGDPANLIAISPTRVPPGQVISVPRGLRNLPAAGQQDGGASGSPSAGPPASASTSAPGAVQTSHGSGSVAVRAANGAGKTGAGGTAGSTAKNSGPGGSAAAGDAAADRNHPPAPSAPAAANKAGPAAAASARDRDARATASSGRGNPPAPGSSLPAHPDGAAADRPARAEGVIQIDHPANGNFDVVITQSTPDGDSPEVAAMLTGNPVYTVYLQVGDRREWRLEYCLPARENSGGNPYQVFVGDSTPISPPYPVSTAIPDAVLSLPHARDIIFHGYLTAVGRFRDLVPHEAGNQLAARVAPLLSTWRFRPPTRDKVAVEIEVVLVVPKSL